MSIDLSDDEVDFLEKILEEEEIEFRQDRNKTDSAMIRDFLSSCILKADIIKFKLSKLA